MLRKERRDYALVDLNSIVTDVLALLRSSFIERRIVVETALEPQLPSVHGDRVQLQQVVLNILMNAADAVTAMPDAAGRTLTVTTAVAGPTVSVAVADKGVGISDEGLARMFDPFSRPSPTAWVSTVDLPHDHGRTWRTHRGRASGPGRHLLVLARSRAPQGNKGACRTTSLDSGRGERQGVRRMIAPLPTRMAGTVFVVDDDLSVRRSLERLVKSAGWAVRTLPRLRSYCAKTCLRLIAPVSSPMCTWGT